MSASLGNDLVSSSVDASLAEIDTRSRSQSTGDIVVGPFAVLDLTPSVPAPTGQVEHDQSVTVQDEGPASPLDIAPVDAGAEEMATFDPFFSMIDPLAPVDDSLCWPDLLGFDFDLMPPTLDMGSYFPDGDTGISSGMQPFGMEGQDLAQGGLEQVAEPVNPTQDIPMTTPADSDALSEGPFLFRHFQDKVIPQMMTMPLGEKSPWNILNMQTAMVTFSELTILGSQNINHARLANLYSLLACSAVHLSMRTGSPTDSVRHWQQAADRLFQHAIDNMQMSLRYELQEPKKSKYKDQLMAICCLTQFAVRSPTMPGLC